MTMKKTPLQSISLKMSFLFPCSMLRLRSLSLLIPTLALALSSNSANGADWYRWRGLDLNGISKEKNWSVSWPKEGPKQLWKVSVGTGFSSVSISQGRVYTMGNENNTDTVFCFDTESGKTIWKHSYPCDKNPKYYEGGPSVTPTIDDGKVYTFSRAGDLFCFEAATGKIVWSKNIQKELNAEVPTWGFAGSPLVEGDLLVLNIGEAGTALNKSSGKVVWTSGREASGYSTPVPFDFNQQRCVAIFGGKALYAVDLKSGKEVWNFPWKTSYDVNAADPIFAGQQVFISSGYGTGGGLIDFKDGKPSAVWKSKEMHNQFNSCVLINGHLYGISGHDGQPSDLRCVELQTGKVRWTEKSAGLGSLMAADGKLIVLSDTGELILAEATPTAFKPLARAQILGGKCWSTPALSNGRIYARNARGDLICIDARRQQTAQLN